MDGFFEYRYPHLQNTNDMRWSDALLILGVKLAPCELLVPQKYSIALFSWHGSTLKGYYLTPRKLFY